MDYWRSPGSLLLDPYKSGGGSTARQPFGKEGKGELLDKTNPLYLRVVVHHVWVSEYTLASRKHNSTASRVRHRSARCVAVQLAIVFCIS